MKLNSKKLIILLSLTAFACIQSGQTKSVAECIQAAESVAALRANFEEHHPDVAQAFEGVQNEADAKKAIQKLDPSKRMDVVIACKKNEVRLRSIFKK